MTYRPVTVTPSNAATTSDDNAHLLLEKLIDLQRIMIDHLVSITGDEIEEGELEDDHD